MYNVAIGITGISILLVLISMRFPIGVTLIAVSFGGLFAILGERSAWSTVGIVTYNFAANWQLSSVPMFLLMGFICFHAGLTKGLFNAASLWLSRLPGGLAVSSIFASAGFASVTGSSVACAAAMGRIAVPEMTRHKYDVALATGTVAAAGTIGALIPPSILLILFGIIAEVPISALFLGGIGAGLLTAVSYVAVVVIRVMLKPELAPMVSEKVTWGERFNALKDTWQVILIIVGVFGGLFGGVFTPTEAGAVGASLSIVAALLNRSLTWKKLIDAFRETLITSSTLFIIAIGASLLTRFLAVSGAGTYLSELIGLAGTNPYLLLLIITLIYLVLGMFLEPIGAMLLTVPILLPVLEPAGFSLIWFGVLLAKFLEIGMITPPIGMNVFVIRGVVGDLARTGTIFRGVAWFLLADLVVVLLLIMVPDIILFFPSLAD